MATKLYSGKEGRSTGQEKTKDKRVKRRKDGSGAEEGETVTICLKRTVVVECQLLQKLLLLKAEGALGYKNSLSLLPHGGRLYLPKKQELAVSRARGSSPCVEVSI